MKLDETQRKQVAEWVEAGLKLAEIQKRMDSELGLRMTYMEARFLVDDLKLSLKDPEILQPTNPPLASVSPTPKPVEPVAPTESLPISADVSVAVDKITRPGALVSGKVSFSDGNNAEWHLDQTGRLGLVSQVQGYRPTPGDIQKFQSALEMELSKLGF
ncbi:MAG: hypothetical protein U1F65_02600 [Verrucomicrobiota bacterium]